MPRRVAVQMDPIAPIDLPRETTFLLGLEAQKRGYHLWYYTPDRLSWKDGKITARARRLTLSAKAPHYELGKPESLDLKTMDVILLRQDPPFDMAYVTNTYFLEMLQPKTLVVNHPAAVRDLPEKLFPLQFRKFMPPTLITSDMDEITRFHKAHKNIVIKPLYGHSGHNVFRAGPGTARLAALMKKRLAQWAEPWIIQRFLPQMKTGERRVIFIDGKIAGVLGRIPARGAITADLHAGARYTKATLTRRQKTICAAIGPALKKHGVLFAGIDIIGDWLTEINLTSPGSLIGMREVYGKKLEADFWDAVEARW